MAEQQNIEYKRSWHDDYLKWICGFANAQGGNIFIGKDDDGSVIHLEKYKELMEEIPSKISHLLGIIVEVNLLEENKKRFIEIVVPRYSVPISLRGRYYYRSGSTKQELTGSSLNEFLLEKSGKTWDDVIEPRASFEDIDEDSIVTFLKSAERAGRLPEKENLSIPELLEKLRLTEDGHLKRAAIVLFGKDPGRFYPNTFVKIGRFGIDDADLKFQETEDGNLISLIYNVTDQLNRKFLVRKIEFEGIHRVEKGEYPVTAIREMVLNALIHRNYMGAPTQIRVYDDRISIWNYGVLPAGITLDDLKISHSSVPRNPILADAAFKGGYIDSWGRGTIKIIDDCEFAGLPEPEMIDRNNGFLLTVFKNVSSDIILVGFELNERQKRAILFIKENKAITRAEYQEINNIGRSIASKELSELVDKGYFLSSGRGRVVKYTVK